MAKRPDRPTAPQPAAPTGPPSSLVDKTIMHCGDGLDQFRKFPDVRTHLIYIDLPFNSNYEVFWGETKETRAFEDCHASTQAYIDTMGPRVAGDVHAAVD